MYDLIVLLKAYTNGLFEMDSPQTLKALWDSIVAAMKHSHRQEKMVWRKMSEAYVLLGLARSLF